MSRVGWTPARRIHTHTYIYCREMWRFFPWIGLSSRPVNTRHDCTLHHVSDSLSVAAGQSHSHRKAYAEKNRPRCHRGDDTVRTRSFSASSKRGDVTVRYQWVWTTSSNSVDLHTVHVTDTTNSDVDDAPQRAASASCSNFFISSRRSVFVLLQSSHFLVLD